MPPKPKSRRKRVGSWVSLKEPTRPARGVQKARIVEECPQFARGAVILSWPLEESRWWNKDALVAVDPPSPDWVRRWKVRGHAR